MIPILWERSAVSNSSENPIRNCKWTHLGHWHKRLKKKKKTTI